MQIQKIWSEYIKPYSNGCSMHYNMLQENMIYFEHPNGIIAYVRYNKTCFVLSEPVCKYNDEQKLSDLVSDFLIIFPSSVFMCIGKEFAQFLHMKFNFNATQIGTERLLDLDKWKVKGQKKQIIRTAMNKAGKLNIKVVENNSEHKIYQKLDDWLQTRKIANKKITFLIRSHSGFEPDTRTFCAYDNENKLIGYIQFNPIYKRGEISGYLPEISSGSVQFKQGIFYVILTKAIEVFRNEGIQFVNLGLAPLILNNDISGFESKVLRPFLKWVRKINYYNFEGINFTKSRFLDRNHKEGQQLNIYFAHKNVLPFFKILQLLRVLNII